MLYVARASRLWGNWASCPVSASIVTGSKDRIYRIVQDCFFDLILLMPSSLEQRARCPLAPQPGWLCYFTCASSQRTASRINSRALVTPNFSFARATYICTVLTDRLSFSAIADVLVPCPSI